MVALLSVEKRRLLEQNGTVTHEDFRRAWLVCWEVMVDERAWAHATYYRRSSRAQMLATRQEARLAVLDVPSAFATATGELSKAASSMCLRLSSEQQPQALLAAINYVETNARQPVAA